MTDEATTQKKEASELAREAREWVASEAGREAMERILAQAEKAQNELREAQRVDPDTLNVPVNM